MDLRVQKTLSLIETEFLALRSKNALNQIRVHELCKNAQINKSTFYRHYTDVFALSGQIENRLLDQILADFATIDLLFSNPEQFIAGLFAAIQPYNHTILILFEGRMDVLADKMERRLKERYRSDSHPQERDIILSFLIGGATHVFLNTEYDLNVSAKTLATLMSNLAPA